MNFKNGKPVVRVSGLNQLIECPASRTIVAKLRTQDEDDSASWEGQYCHYQAACRFIDKQGAMAPEGGLLLPNIPADWKPESFAEWLIEFYHRAVAEETPGDWALSVEEEMIYEFPRFWLSGHVDVNAIAPDASALNFDDLKCVVNPVDEAPDNWQVLGYAVLFKVAYGDRLKRIRGRIIQPRIKEEEGKRVSGVVLDERGTWNDAGELVGAATINDIVAGLEAKINAALDNPMLLNDGPKQCRWCPADLQCPALREKRKFMKMILTKEALDAIEATPNDQLLAEWALGKKLLGSKLEKAWNLMKERLATVKEVTMPDGTKLMLTDWQGARELLEEHKPAVWEEICNQLDEARAYACLDLSIPTLERKFAEQLGLPIESKKGDSGKRQVEERFGAAITRKAGKQLTIVL